MEPVDIFAVDLFDAGVDVSAVDLLESCDGGSVVDLFEPEAFISVADLFGISVVDFFDVLVVDISGDDFFVDDDDVSGAEVDFVGGWADMAQLKGRITKEKAKTFLSIKFNEAIRSEQLTFELLHSLILRYFALNQWFQTCSSIPTYDTSRTHHASFSFS